MKWLALAALGTALLAACAGSSTANEPGAPATGVPPACADGETVVFACRTGPGHGVALCGSGDASRMRYLESGPAAVTWPASGAARSTELRSGSLMYSGGGGAYLRFDREGHTHTVYTGIGRGWEKAGVLVEENGRTVRELTCTGEVTSLIGPALFERAAIPADEAGFEIP